MNAMKAFTFGMHLQQFAWSVDHVTEATFLQALELIATYAHKELDFRYFEFMTPHLVEDKDGLESKYIYLDGKRRTKKPYATQIFQGSAGRKPKTLCSLAYHKQSPLWVVSKTMNLLRDCRDPEDQWSKESVLPKYKRISELEARTSVVVPVVSAEECLGVIDLEGEAHIRFSEITKRELNRIVECVARLAFLYNALEVQSEGSKEALDKLGEVLDSGAFRALGTPKLFLAYPGEARQDVLAMIKEALDGFRDRIEVVDWSKLYKPGNISIELLEQITRCRFGICYFSEEISRGTGHFQDNSNVLFEAGMMYALVSQRVCPLRGWIPIREADPNTPFDLKFERRIDIRRNEEGEIVDYQKTVQELTSMLLELLDDP